MSGYLEVKLTIKANRGLTPWKAWKKQWCILRPSPVKEDCIIIVFHTSAGLASNSQVDIPRNSIVCRTESKTKMYSFGIFPSIESRKPILLLAGQSERESQLWMQRIRSRLSGRHPTEKCTLQKNYFNVSIIDNEFTNTCGFKGLYGLLKVSHEGFQIVDASTKQSKAFFSWDHVDNAYFSATDKTIDNSRICIVNINSKFSSGPGQIFIYSQSGKSLLKSLQNKTLCTSPEITLRKLNRRISRSEGTLFNMSDIRNNQFDENLRDSGLSSCGPTYSENGSKWDCTSQDSNIRISMDDNGFVLKGKVASTLISAGLLLSSSNCSKKSSQTLNSDEESINDDCLSPLMKFTDLATGFSDRRCSGTSIGSGIYEEISEQIPDYSVNRHIISSENAYEVLGDCIYGTTRRVSRRLAPPPLPPKNKMNFGKLDSASDSGLEEESLCSTPLQDTNDLKWAIHGSLSSLQNCFDVVQPVEDTARYGSDTFGKSILKNCDRFHSALEVFRKRMKSDSQVSKKDNSSLKDPDTLSFHSTASGSGFRKKRLHGAPAKSIDLIRNCKMGRAFRKLGKSNNFNGAKYAAKSCETLDCDDVGISLSKRCSKSEHNLDLELSIKPTDNEKSYETKKKNYINLSSEWCVENDDENIKDLSVIFAENKTKNEDVMELLLRGRLDLAWKVKNAPVEDEYMPMSPCGRLSSKPTPSPFSNPAASALMEDNYMVMKSA